MTTYARYFDPETLSRLKTLSLRGQHLADGFLAGAHRSSAMGRSTEFSQHRQYTPGDDLRQIDWKVFARSDRYYVKQFENEANLHCLLALDTSCSMAYQSPRSPMSKLEYAQLVIMTLAGYLLHQRDATTLVTYSQNMHHYLGPSGKAGQWHDMLEALKAVTPDAVADVATAVEQMVARTHRRSLFVFVSDFLDDLTPLRACLGLLKHERHDAILFQTLDRSEVEFPFRHTTTFHGLEENRRQVIDPWSVKNTYLRLFEQHQQDLRNLAREFGFEHSLFLTDQNLADVLPPFLAKRQKRMRAGS